MSYYIIFYRLISFQKGSSKCAYWMLLKLIIYTFVHTFLFTRPADCTYTFKTWYNFSYIVPSYIQYTFSVANLFVFDRQGQDIPVRFLQIIFFYLKNKTFKPILKFKHPQIGHLLIYPLCPMEMRSVLSSIFSLSDQLQNRGVVGQNGFLRRSSNCKKIE